MSDKSKVILLTPNDVPGDGLMSSPVLQRSLDAVSGEFDAHFATFCDVDSPTPRYVKLKFREWWWPPGRFGLHNFLRARDLVRSMRLGPKDRIIAVHPFSQELALAIKSQSGCPYIVIVHDLHKDRLADPSVQSGLRAASSVLCASPALVKAIEPFAPHATVLFPCPGPPLELEPKYNDGPIGVPGHFCSWSLALASSLGLPIQGIGQPLSMPDRPDFQRGTLEITFVPRFASNDDAVSFIAENCSAFCVTVPSDGSDYEMTSFPSKFIDFTRASLPIVIIAKPQSVIGKWAVANDWPLYIPDEQDTTHCKVIASRLRDPDSWYRDQARVIELRDGIFSNRTINSQLLDAVRAAQ